MLRLVAITCPLIGMIADEGSDPDFRRDMLLFCSSREVDLFVLLTSEERSDHDPLCRITDCPSTLYS